MGLYLQTKQSLPQARLEVKHNRPPGGAPSYPVTTGET